MEGAERRGRGILIELFIGVLMIYAMLILLSFSNNTISKVIWAPFLLLIIGLIETSLKRKSFVSAEGGWGGSLKRLRSWLGPKYAIVRKLSDNEKEFKGKFKNTPSTDPFEYDFNFIEYIRQVNEKDRLEYYYNILENRLSVKKNTLVLFISLFITVFIALVAFFANGLNTYVMLYVQDGFDQYKKEDSNGIQNVNEFPDIIFNLYTDYLSKMYIGLLSLSTVLIFLLMLLFLFFTSYHFKGNRYFVILKTILKK